MFVPKHISRRASQSGFTLMELLVVLVILGFLLGMVAPRLGSVADNAVGTVCDTNNKGIRYFTKIYLDETGRYPNHMTNLVHTGSAVTPASPTAAEITEIDAMSISGMSEENAGELHPAFAERMLYTLRTLDVTEAAELKELGISTVRQFVGASDQPLEAISVAAGLKMANVGLGDTLPGDTAAIETVMDDTGNPFWYGRFILGVGESCSLMTDGYIQAAALCPGGIQNEDVVAYNNYVVVLPRLASTVALLDATADVITDSTTGDPIDITITADMDGDGTADADERDEIVQIVAQEKWDFQMACPEGHMWPDNDNDVWTTN